MEEPPSGGPGGPGSRPSWAQYQWAAVDTLESDLADAQAQLADARSAQESTAAEAQLLRAALQAAHATVCGGPSGLPGAASAGIGIAVQEEVVKLDGKAAKMVVVKEVRADGPAGISGVIAKGDVILEVDGVPVTGLGIARVKCLLRGPENGLVEVRGRHVSASAPCLYEVTLQRSGEASRAGAVAGAEPGASPASAPGKGGVGAASGADACGDWSEYWKVSESSAGGGHRPQTSRPAAELAHDICEAFRALCVTSALAPETMGTGHEHKASASRSCHHSATLSDAHTEERVEPAGIAERERRELAGFVERATASALSQLEAQQDQLQTCRAELTNLQQELDKLKTSNKLDLGSLLWTSSAQESPLAASCLIVERVHAHLIDRTSDFEILRSAWLQESENLRTRLVRNAKEGKGPSTDETYADNLKKTPHLKDSIGGARETGEEARRRAKETLRKAEMAQRGEKEACEREREARLALEDTRRMWEQARKRHQHEQEELRCELLRTQAELKASILAAQQSRERETRLREEAMQAQEAVRRSATALVEEVGILQQQVSVLEAIESDSREKIRLLQAETSYLHSQLFLAEECDDLRQSSRGSSRASDHEQGEKRASEADLGTDGHGIGAPRQEETTQMLQVQQAAHTPGEDAQEMCANWLAVSAPRADRADWMKGTKGEKTTEQERETEELKAGRHASQEGGSGEHDSSGERQIEDTDEIMEAQGPSLLSLSLYLKQQVEEQKRDRRTEQEEWARERDSLEGLVREREQRICRLEEEVQQRRKDSELVSRDGEARQLGEEEAAAERGINFGSRDERQCRQHGDSGESVGKDEGNDGSYSLGVQGESSLSLSLYLKQQVEEQKRERRLEQEEWAAERYDLESRVREGRQKVCTLQEEVDHVRAELAEREAMVSEYRQRLGGDHNLGAECKGDGGAAAEDTLAEWMGTELVKYVKLERQTSDVERVVGTGISAGSDSERTEAIREAGTASPCQATCVTAPETEEIALAMFDYFNHAAVHGTLPLPAVAAHGNGHACGGMGSGIDDILAQKGADCRAQVLPMTVTERSGGVLSADESAEVRERAAAAWRVRLGRSRNGEGDRYRVFENPSPPPGVNTLDQLDLLERQLSSIHDTSTSPAKSAVSMYATKAPAHRLFYAAEEEDAFLRFRRQGKRALDVAK